MSDDSKFPYTTHLNILYGSRELIDVPKLVRQCTDEWYNQTLCKVNDSVLRLGILRGEYHWHKHDEDDELFFVLSGRLEIELEDADPVVLEEQQGYVVPRGLKHRPVAPERTVVLMMETANIIPTGDEE